MVAERDLENALTSRITETLRELGPGFAFVRRQVHSDVDGDDFYLDFAAQMSELAQQIAKDPYNLATFNLRGVVT